MNQALKIRKGVEIKLCSIAISIFRSCMLPSLSICKFAIFEIVKRPRNGQSATDSRREWYGLKQPQNRPGALKNSWGRMPLLVFVVFALYTEVLTNVVCPWCTLALQHVPQLGYATVYYKRFQVVILKSGICILWWTHSWPTLAFLR